MVYVKYRWIAYQIKKSFSVRIKTYTLCFLYWFICSKIVASQFFWWIWSTHFYLVFPNDKVLIRCLLSFHLKSSSAQFINVYIIQHYSPSHLIRVCRFDIRFNSINFNIKLKLTLCDIMNGTLHRCVVGRWMV